MRDRLKRWVKRNATWANFWRLVVVAFFSGFALWGIRLSHLNRDQLEWVIGNSELGLLLTTACMGVAPELAGIVIGAVIIDFLNEWRQDNQLKQQLILQMRSRHNDVADTAVRALRARGWISDGSLRNAGLGNANLAGADLSEADLRGAWLRWAVLKGVFLVKAKLERADLRGANLDGAVLTGASLRGAKNWSIRQLGQATGLVGAIMPDGVRLRVSEAQARGPGIPPNPDGPTFNEWAAMQIESVDQQAIEDARKAVAGDLEEE